MTAIYIIPITTIHSTFAEAKGFFDKSDDISFFDEKEKLDIPALAQGTRNLIVGEPGIGKSLLLDKIQEHLRIKGITTKCISLRQPNALDQIDDFLKLNVEGSKTLLLDALDEIKSSLFPSVIQKIEEISSKYPGLSLFISSRWVFVSRYAASFPEYRFITISPFTNSQVRDYLTTAGHNKNDVDLLLNRVMSFSHRMLVIQIPRYLFYLEEFLNKKGIEAASQVSRNELFEYFIYSKLELEEKKLNEDNRAITKRVLEKLALTMEIYQSNVITKDELMTFFDDLKSDLKRAALSQISIDTFYKYSLLKVSQEDLDRIEFENTEFQEYLAAKEITRFSDPNHAAFGFAVDPAANELYPSWFNALTFLVDMQPDILDQLIEFSGLRANRFRVMDEAFLIFLSRIDPRKISKDLKHVLFSDVIKYHERTRQWISGQLSHALSGFFDLSLEPYLKERVAAAEVEEESKRFVPLRNISYIVANLLQDGVLLDRIYWRTKLLSYASEKNQNDVLQRHALHALQCLGDATVIDDLPNLIDSDELSVDEFLSMCTELAPDHPKSLQYFFDAVKRNHIRGRYGLFAIKQAESVKKFLKTFLEDESFRREFMENASIYDDKDHILVENIERILDDETRSLAKKVLVQSLHWDLAHYANQSPFISGLWKLLRRGDPKFVPDMVELIYKNGEAKVNQYFANDFFEQVIEKSDVEPYIRSMNSAGIKYAAHNTMLSIKFSERKDANEIYETGRPFLEEEYKKWEEDQGKEISTPTNKRAQKFLDEFRVLLEPAPGKYSENVFDYFNKHLKDIEPLLTTDDHKRIEKLLSGTIFKHIDPGKFGVTITQKQGGPKEFTQSSVIHLFGSALRVAKHINFDITPYRQQILNYIPFAFNEELTTIFDLIKDIKSQEISPVIEVYRSHHSDLWRHNPLSFVEAIKNYRIVEAAPVLKTLILESAWENYARREAITVLDSIAPDPAFLQRIFEEYKDSANYEDQKLAHIANALLVTTHPNKDAIRWRLQQIIIRAAAFIRPTGKGAHFVSDLEEEISFSKKFAKPLMDLKYTGYEEDYIKLLDDAMEIWAKGREFHEYATYVWEIVYAYFDNLKEKQSYTPLLMLEEKIANLKDRDGANWLAGRMTSLRRSYLTYLGKMDNISKAIAKYNDAREHSDKKIRNSNDLFRQVQIALDVDLRRWIEGEGAYDVLGYKVARSGRQEYEKLIQKTLKGQIENVLLKQGFQVDILREPQLLDDKRIDLIVRYGFAGPIIIEVKLTSNTDIQGKKIEGSSSYSSMEQYMQGYGAAHGIFMIIDNAKAKNLPRVIEVFQKIKGVGVLSFDCSKKLPKRKKVRKETKRAKVKQPRNRKK